MTAVPLLEFCETARAFSTRTIPTNMSLLPDDLRSLLQLNHDSSKS
jgi:hypothetical protein